MKKPAIILLTLVLISYLSYADDPPVKFGKVTKKELMMESYEKDPDADAVVLCDYGTAEIDYNPNSESWQTQYYRICRIKIFNTSGLKWATESILLYDDKSTDENISKLKGYTYNLENGKIVKTKLDKDNIFDEDHSEYYNKKKFTLPNAKEGSVIEFRYKIYSDVWYRLNDWAFQRSIPVKWSEYKVRIPEYLNFLHLSQGYESFAHTEQTQKNNIISANLQYIDNVYHWIAKDMPGLKKEELISSPDNFYQKIEFQLSGYKDTYGAYHDKLGNWKNANEELMDSENFGRHLRTRGFYSDVIDNIKSKHDSQAEQAYAIYKYVSEYIKWNGDKRNATDTNIKKTYNERVGNSADINFLLISMLNAAEITAKPVITSTIDNGYINPIYPILSKYNYLIAEVKIDDKTILMDATEKNLPLGVLPYRALNKMGRRIDEGMGDWVNIAPSKGEETMFYAVFDLNMNGELAGNVQIRKEGYSAINSRNAIRTNGEEKYLQTLKENRPDWEINNFNIENKSDVFKSFKEEYELVTNAPVVSAGGILYINPILEQQFDENPLKQESRKLPVELVYPHQYNYIFVINLPEGYMIDELPEATRLRLPNNGGTFSYTASKLGNRIQVISKLNIMKTTFAPNEYPYLKEFVDQVFAKHDEQLVLKKGTPDEATNNVSESTENE